MTQTAGTRPLSRRGSMLSDKQIVEASRRGRKVIFRFVSSLPGHEVEGYVVGMDDYHWMVATPRQRPSSAMGHGDHERWEQAPLSTTLVHKSAPLIVLDPTPSLDSEDKTVVKAINKIREPFLASLDQKEPQP